jgi:hypothetical protein
MIFLVEAAGIGGGSGMVIQVVSKKCTNKRKTVMGMGKIYYCKGRKLYKVINVGLEKFPSIASNNTRP